MTRYKVVMKIKHTPETTFLTLSGAFGVTLDEALKLMRIAAEGADLEWVRLELFK
jgi:hypothetical protein